MYLTCSSTKMAKRNSLSSNGAMENFSLRPITSNIETASYHQLANYYLQLLTEWKKFFVLPQLKIYSLKIVDKMRQGIKKASLYRSINYLKIKN